MGLAFALTLPGLVRDDEDDGAPPHSRIDVAAGVARLHLTERVRG